MVDPNRLIRNASIEFSNALTRRHAEILQSGDEAVDQVIQEELGRLLRRLDSTGLVGSANQQPSQNLWWIAGPILMSGWLQTRAREKPCGYAGDFLLLDRIAQQWISGDPLAAGFDRYFQSQAAPKAVRNRMSQVADKIVDRTLRQESPVKIVSVGAGSAREIVWAAARLAGSGRMIGQVILLDIDERALAYARSLLNEALPAAAVTTRRENLYRFHRKPAVRSLLAGADAIYCLGLFDYLSNDVAAEMLKVCWSALAPDGELTFFNFASQHATRSYMEWVGNWYLTYRSTEDLLEIAADAGLRDFAAVDREPLGINLYLQAIKPLDG